MTNDASILVVEDDDDLQDVIRIAGVKRSYAMRVARNGVDAVRQIEEGYTPDLIVLDITMPAMDGFTFCRWLRDAHPLVPVIFLSARAEEYDKLLALEIGGDDYLTKPFSMKELFARVSVSLRRVRLYLRGEGGGARASSVSAGDLVLDPDRWTCSYRGVDVILTVSEFRILHRLATNPDIVIDRAGLAEAAYPDDRYSTGRSVDIHVHRIRAKLRAISSGFDALETVYQVGYRWRS